MRLSYVDVLGDGERHQIDARITTEHSQSSYGQPVIVLPDGGLLDATSWVLMAYQIVKASEAEYELLRKWISLLTFLVSGGEQHEMTVSEAVALAESMGQRITDRTIRLAAENGYIQNARRAGRDWLIPRDGLMHYLENRPKPGRK